LCKHWRLIESNFSIWNRKKSEKYRNKTFSLQHHVRFSDGSTTNNQKKLSEDKTNMFQVNLTEFAPGASKTIRIKLVQKTLIWNGEVFMLKGRKICGLKSKKKLFWFKKHAFLLFSKSWKKFVIEIFGFFCNFRWNFEQIWFFLFFFNFNFNLFIPKNALTTIIQA
jgi:hypothetical protein